MRILLVEDNPDLADAIVRRMRRSGHAVDWQSDGLAAASVLRYQSFDLVVLDIGLPKLDGLRVLAGMRERGDATPVLMLTARDGIEDRVQALDVGADDYLASRSTSANSRRAAACCCDARADRPAKWCRLAASSSTTPRTV
jgi:two-component system response regulator TctD